MCGNWYHTSLGMTKIFAQCTQYENVKKIAETDENTAVTESDVSSAFSAIRRLCSSHFKDDIDCTRVMLIGCLKIGGKIVLLQSFVCSLCSIFHSSAWINTYEYYTEVILFFFFPSFLLFETQELLKLFLLAHHKYTLMHLCTLNLN